MTKLLARVVPVLCLLGTAHACLAIDVNWNVAGPADFNNAANWNPAVLPGGGDRALIDNGGTATISGALTNPTINEIHVNLGAGAGNAGTLNQTAGTLNTNRWIVVGTNGTGTYNLSGGTVNQNSDIFTVGENNGSQGFLNVSGTGTVNSTRLLVGRNGGSTGTVTLADNGTIVAPQAHIGLDGTGNMTQTGGTFTSPNWIVVGTNAGGTYNITGGTINQNSDFFTVGENNGSNGLFQVGGTAVVNAQEFRIGRNGGSFGRVEQTGGTINTVNPIRVGQSGTGEFDLSGGTANSFWVEIGENNGSNGTFNVSGTGNLDPTNEIQVGRNGTGTFNQSGGTVDAAWLHMGEGGGGTGNGTTNLSGGTLTLNDPNAVRNGNGTSTFNLTGGLLDLTDGQFHVDNLTFSGGTMRNATDIGVGVAAGVTDLTITGTGVLQRNQAGTTTVNTLFLHDTASLDVSAGNVQINGQLQVGENAGANATVDQTGGTVNVNQWVNIGHNGAGTYNISAGTLNANHDLNIGDQNGAAAIDGTLNISGTGIVNQTTADPQATYVGKNGATGVLTIADSGQFNATGPIQIGEGAGSVGTVTQTGGTVTANQWINIGHGGAGTYNISGGLLDANHDINVGDVNGPAAVDGLFNISGTADVDGGVIFVGKNGSTGVINQSGGTLDGTWMELATGGGNGTFNLTGGTATLTDPTPIRNPDGDSTINIDGGTLNLTNANANATVDNLNIGLNANGSHTIDNNHNYTVNNNLVVGGNATGNLTVADTANVQVNGQIQIGDAATGVGTITQTGGTVTANQWINVGHNGQGSYNISGGTLNANHDLNVGDQNGPAAIDGTMNISGTAQVNVNNNSMFIGKNNSTGLVTQTGGNVFSNVDIQLGSNTAGSTGQYDISGGTVTANRAFIVGELGQGTVNQTGGDVTANQWLQVGRVAGSTGTYNLSGGTATGLQTVNIGESGVGTMTVSNNAQLISGGQIEVSRNASAAGSSLTLQDNAVATAGSNVLVGLNNGSNGTLNVSGNSSLTTPGGTDIRFGNAAGATGTGNISGGTLTAGRAFIVGEAGTGTVNQSGGDVTANQWLQVGRIGGSTGTYNLSGGTATGLQTVNVGESGVGTMTVSGTAQLISGGQIEVSREGTSAGSSLTLNGDSVATAASNVLVGLNNGSNGTLNVNDNASLTTTGANTDIRFGNAAGATGNGFITGGAVSANRAFIVGEAGTGVLNQSGGDVTAGNWLQVGRIAGSTGTYNLSGGTATGADTVNIGESGFGEMTVSGTGQLISGGQIEVSREASSAGSSLTIQDNGSATATTNVLVGLNANSNGTVNVEGGTLTAPDDLVVGQSGTGTLNVSGGVTTAGDLIVAQNAGSTGTTNQTGGTINVTNPTTMIVGDAGVGVSNQSGGVTNVAGNLILGNQATGDGTYNLSGTGELNVGLDATIANAGTGTFNQTGGIHTVQQNMDVGVFAGTGAYNLTGGILDFNDTNTSQSNVPAQGAGPPAESVLTIGANGSFTLDASGNLRDVRHIDPTAAPGGPTFTQLGGTLTVGSDVIAEDPAFVGGALPTSGDVAALGTERFVSVIGNANDDWTETGIANFVTGGGSSPATLEVDVFGPGAIGVGEGTQALNNGGTTNPLTLVTDSDLLVVEGFVDASAGLTIEANWLFDPFENPLEFYDVLYATEGFTDDSVFNLAGDATLLRIVDDGNGGQFLQVAAPEPATIAIWSLIGAALFGGYIRRRRRK